MEDNPSANQRDVKPWDLFNGSPRSPEELAKYRLEICSDLLKDYLPYLLIILHMPKARIPANAIFITNCNI